MADATKATARISVTWPIPRPLVVCEKNIFHLFRYNQPVENYPYLLHRILNVTDFSKCSKEPKDGAIIWENVWKPRSILLASCIYALRGLTFFHVEHDGPQSKSKRTTWIKLVTLPSAHFHTAILWAASIPTVTKSFPLQLKCAAHTPLVWKPCITDKVSFDKASHTCTQGSVPIWPVATMFYKTVEGK